MARLNPSRSTLRILEKEQQIARLTEALKHGVRGKAVFAEPPTQEPESAEARAH